MSAQQRQISFDLDEGMLKAISKEFDIQKVTDRFAEAIASRSGDAIDKAAGEIFGEYGKRWMKRTIELGEKHTDRTYETLKKTIEKTKHMYFPLVPQRFVEIAYLSTHPISTLPILQNNGEKLVYRLPRCNTFRIVREKCGEGVAKSLPCRHACLIALETLFKDLNIDVTIEMEASMPKNDFCQFAAAEARTPMGL